MALVFIAGHGRMVMGEPDQTVPGRVTVAWAVPAECSSNPRISRNAIAGMISNLSDVAKTGEKYNEHWLVPDGPENMVLKAKDLVNALAGTDGYKGSRSLPASTYWLLQPRANNAVKLSAILNYLLVKIPGDDHIDVIWTCCRSPIGQPGLWSAEIDLSTETYTVKKKLKGDTVSDPLKPHDFKDNRSTEGYISHNKHNFAEGTVTLVNGSDTATMLSRATWVGYRGGKNPEAQVLPEGDLSKKEIVSEFVINQRLPV